MLLSSYIRKSYSHGGDTSAGKRKTARPITTRTPMHVVFSAKVEQQEYSFFTKRNAQLVKRVFKTYKKRYGLKIFHFAMSPNSIHLIVKARTRSGLQTFMKLFAGTIAKSILIECQTKRSKRKFWKNRAFTQFINLGKEFSMVMRNIWFREILRLINNYTQDVKFNRGPP